MKVIWHERVNGAEEGMSYRGVKEEFAEFEVKDLVEPALGSVGGGEGPKNRCGGAIAGRIQARQGM